MKVTLVMFIGCALLLAVLPICAESEPLFFHEMTVESDEHKSCKLAFVIFDAKRVELKVISNGSDFSQPKYETLKQALRENGCVAGTNGGFFDVDPFSAVGYLVVDSKVIAERPDKPWMDGLVMVESDRLMLGDIDNMLVDAKPQMALQSGPRLVFNGTSDVDLLGKREARRTFIGRGTKNRWILGVSSTVTLKDLSMILVSPEVSEFITLDYVLNLDGGPSTGLFVEKGGVAVFDRKTSRVQNYIGIALR